LAQDLNPLSSPTLAESYKSAAPRLESEANDIIADADKLLKKLKEDGENSGNDSKPPSKETEDPKPTA